MKIFSEVPFNWRLDEKRVPGRLGGDATMMRVGVMSFVFVFICGMFSSAVVNEQPQDLPESRMLQNPTDSGGPPALSEGSSSAKDESCDDDNVCTMDYYDPELGCIHVPLDCNDYNPSTIDTCDPWIGCINTPLNCDDGNACTIDTTDGQGGCSNIPVDCDDGDPSTLDTCDPATGDCIHTTLPHPADINEDFRMVLSEAIAYLAGWQQGGNPMAYAIRAAYLWQNGERYTYNSSLEPPMCWTLPEPPKTLLLPGDVPLELVRIPAGSFQMGSPDTEHNRYINEGPIHTVTIAYDFYMSKYEVTQQQWLAVMGSSPGGYAWNYGQGDTYPAYYVSWDDAQAFITALNTHITNTGQGPATVRLPSEAEWEYACRAGTQTRFYFGDLLSVGDECEDDGIRSQYMWYCGNDDSYGSKPVGGKLPNAFGLHDMSGNLLEWCQDWLHSSYTDAPADGSAWESPTDSGRVIRGGYWYRYAQYCRSAFRYGIWPDDRYGSLGFRLVR